MKLLKSTLALNSMIWSSCFAFIPNLHHNTYNFPARLISDSATATTSTTILNANSSNDEITILSLVEKLEFNRQFERYRYMQNLMEGEIKDVNEINMILHHMLKRCNKLPEGYDSIESFQPLLGPGGKAGDDAVLLSQLEALLPTMEDDEDGHKGLWDIVCELHGRESVRIFKGRNQDWDVRCLVVRCLIDFQFLHDGVQV